jgi:ERCC4-type nuclease
MLIRIDNREQDLIKLVNQLILTIPAFKELKVAVEVLPLGDIILTENETDKVIIERKSVADLLASIKDGRYEEQSYRLNGIQGHANHNTIYLIEGDVNKINNMKNERMTAYSAMFSLNYYKGFSVFRTFNIDETALFICNTAAKMIRSPDKWPYYQIKFVNFKSNPEDGNTMMDKPANTKDYVGLVKTVKKDNITPDNIAEIMLCQIPGISAATAISIMEKFKTLSNLIASVEADPTCLNNIYNTTAKGQQRKINKNCIDNIVKFLIQK